MSDKIAQLSAAGFQINPQNEAQAAVLKSLTDDEVRVLMSVKERISAAGSDVEGHNNADGGWCW